MNVRLRLGQIPVTGPIRNYLINNIILFSSIGHIQSIKTDVLQIFSIITGDETEFLSPMMFSNKYITGI